jgi:hypothetical protein
MPKIKQSFLMERDDFRGFKLFFKSLIGICDDLYFLDGKVMQKSKNNQLVFGCDLTDIFKVKGKFIFPKIKNEYKKLSILDKYSPIIFIHYDEKLQVQDGMLSSDFKEPADGDFENKTMSLQAINDLLGNGTRLLEAKMQKMLCRRVVTACDGLYSDTVNLKIVKNVAYLSISNQAKDTQAEFKLQHTLMKEMDDVEIIISAIPFRYKKDVILNVYLNEDESNVLIKSEVGISKRIILEVYGKSDLYKIKD